MEYKTTQQLIDDGTIPEELADLVVRNCKFDGFPIIRNLALTSAHCIHPDCRGHMQFRGEELLKYLGIKGIGPATCLSCIKSKGLANHFQLIPVIFKDAKPRLHLWEIAKFCYIPGVSNGWEDMLSGYTTFTEYFASGHVPDFVQPFKYRLLNAEKFFDVKPPLSSRKLDVMITGSINGYGNRDQFISDCNAVVGSLVRVKKCGKKQSANYLICEYKTDLIKSLEAGLSGTGKAEAAWRGGAKIVTSEEFLADLHYLVKEILGSNG